MHTVCLIEDDTVTRKLFVLLLQRAGFTVHDFDNGTRAWEWLQTQAATTVQAVLSNIVLPDGMNGTDILYAVRTSFTRQLRVIALTSFARRGEREQMIALGFDGCIAKPIDPRTFAETLKHLLS
jgi:CheY-like chemotaxis protein